MPFETNPLTIFQQFGYTEDKKSGEHSVGTCPFCHKKEHFYINVSNKNKTWDCKACGESGGFQKFLQTVVQKAKRCNEQKLQELSNNRGITLNTIKAADIGFLNGRYVIPVYSADKKDIINIKIYDGYSFKNTAGCGAAIYGLWGIPDTYTTIYVAEGEWDALTMVDVLSFTKDFYRVAVIGVPGAGTFRSDMVNYFTGKEVYLLYDNDLAGRNGTKKALDIISPVTGDIRVLAWPWDEKENDTKGMKDIRDVHKKLCKKSPAHTLNWIRENCKQFDVKNVSRVDITVHKLDGGIVPASKVYAAFQKWLYLQDIPEHDQKSTDIYDIVFGTVLANRIQGSPVWMYVVAPPGGLKTEPLLALAGGVGIEMIESITPAALISGINTGPNSVDPSLIPFLNGKTGVMKDLTVIFGLPEAELNEILSILRGAFDGECGRIFGNGVRKQFKSTFGLLTAVTPIIEQYTEKLSAVGERFLTWRNWIPEDINKRKEHIRRAIANISAEVEMKRELNTISKLVLLAKYPPPPVISEDIQNKVIAMSQWIAMMRGYVSRDKFSKVMLHKPYSEVATRLSKEIVKWMMGAALFRCSGINDDILRIARCIARSSVSARYLYTIKYMVKTPEEYYSKKDIADGIGLPVETCEIILENMTALNIVDRSLEDNRPVWRVKKSFLELTKEGEVL